jgi:H+/Cl- antiporter ClcA
LIHKNINLFLSAVILSITSTIAFWLAIMLTDYIFLTQMGRIMLELLDGNIFVYALMLTAEGILVGVSQLLLSRKIRSLIGK